jgi:hypothetical protein
LPRKLLANPATRRRESLTTGDQEHANSLKSGALNLGVGRGAPPVFDKRFLCADKKGTMGESLC